MFVSSDSHYSRLSVHWKNAKRKRQCDRRACQHACMPFSCRQRYASAQGQVRWNDAPRQKRTPWAGSHAQPEPKASENGREKPLSRETALPPHQPPTTTTGTPTTGKPPCRRTSRPPQRLALPQHDSYNTPPAGNVKRQKMAPQNAHIIFGEGENRQKNGDQSHVPADISNRSATRSTQCRSMCAIGFDWNMCNMLCSYCVRHASERYGWYHYAERNGRTMHPPQICGTGHMAVSQRQDHGRKHGQGHA